MEEYEVEKSGISIGDIFRTIFSQKWLALIIAVIITIVGTIGLYLYGKTKSVYTATFVLRLPNSEYSPTAYDYPDGTRFHFSDLASTKYLEQVKAESEDFANIDIEKMVEKGDITISRTLEETAQGSGVYEANYKLSIRTKYFKSGEIARSFIIALTEMPGNYLAEMPINVTSNLTASESAVTYEMQFSYLQSQVNTLLSLYDGLISSYGSNFNVDGGNTFSDYRKHIESFINDGPFNQLKNLAIENHYLKSEDSLAQYNSELFEKERRLEREQTALDNLINIKAEEGSADKQTSLVIDGAKIIEQTNIVEQLNQDITDLKEFINSGVIDTEFDKKVSALGTQLKEYTDEYAGVARSVYKTATTINYSESNIVSVEGGTGLVISAAISLVIGIILACIVAYIVGWNKQKKSAPTAINSPAPNFIQAQAQAAVTDESSDKEDK